VREAVTTTRAVPGGDHGGSRVEAHLPTANSGEHPDAMPFGSADFVPGRVVRRDPAVSPWKGPRPAGPAQAWWRVGRGPRVLAGTGVW